MTRNASMVRIKEGDLKGHAYTIPVHDTNETKLLMTQYTS